RRVPIHIGVRDVEQVVRGVLRTERHRQQALFAAAHDEAPDVEERARDLAVANDADGAGLLDDVERVGIAWRGGHVDRGVEPAQVGSERVGRRHLLQLVPNVRVVVPREGQLQVAAVEVHGKKGDYYAPDGEGHQRRRRTRRSSSSFPDSRIASTWSPAWSTVEPTAISARPSRITEMSREPSGSDSASTLRPADGESPSICTSTISRFSPRSSSRWMRSCSGTSCSTSAITLEVAQIVGEIPSRSKCGWLRGSF